MEFNIESGSIQRESISKTVIDRFRSSIKTVLNRALATAMVDVMKMYLFLE
jgi:hypothetical protein